MTPRWLYRLRAFLRSGTRRAWGTGALLLLGGLLLVLSSLPRWVWTFTLGAATAWYGWAVLTGRK